jgi:hypothetical protein
MVGGAVSGGPCFGGESRRAFGDGGFKALVTGWLPFPDVLVLASPSDGCDGVVTACC